MKTQPLDEPGKNSKTVASRRRYPQESRRRFLKCGGAAGSAVLANLLLGGCHTSAESHAASEITNESASNLARLIRARKLSSVDVIKACLSKIDEWNGDVMSVITLNEKQALKRAEEADRAIARGEIWGRLHGVPVTFKDHIQTAGVRTTAGTKAFDHVPDADATVVQRMKIAGAIVLAKTNVSQLAWAMEADNDLFGPTKNPYSLDRTSGGSSGGEAATIAYGGSPLGIGADGGGSIRLPSHYCGIAGIKPSWSRIPNSGTLGAGPFIGVFYDVIGPMARRVEDLHLALDLLKGPDGKDFFSAPVDLKDYRTVDLTTLKVAYFTDMNQSEGGDPNDDVSRFYLGPLPAAADKDTKRVVEAAAKHIGTLSAECVERKPPRLAEAAIAGIWIYAADFRERLDEFFEQHPEDKPHKHLAEISDYLDRYVEKGAASLKSSHEWKVRWYEIASGFHAFMDEVDCIICPVNAEPALPHGHTFRNLDKFAYTFAFNHGGNLPGAVVRCGTSESGLPIGVQVVAPPWKEEISLAVAFELERKFGGWQAPQLPKQ